MLKTLKSDFLDYCKYNVQIVPYSSKPLLDVITQYGLWPILYCILSIARQLE